VLGGPLPPRALPPFLLAIGALVPLWPVVDTYFFSDDFYLLALLHERELLAVLGSGFFLDGAGAERFYRPLANASLLLDLRLFGPDPRAFHLVNIALHALSVALVWRLTERVAPGRLAPPLAAAAFAALPLHAEPIAFVSARGHLLVGLCAAAAVLLHARGARTLGLVAALGALGSHELGIVVPVLLLSHDLATDSRVRAPWLLLHAGAAVVYLALRAAALGEVLPADVLSPPGGWRLLARVGMLLGAAAAALWLVRIARHGGTAAARALAFGAAWSAFAVVPLVPPVELSPRHFYLASFGAALAFGVLASRAVAGRQRAALGPAVALLLAGQAVLLGYTAGEFARTGAHGRALAVEIAAIRSGAAPAVVAVFPDMTGPDAEQWVATLPFALGPPFATGPPPRTLAPDAVLCCDRSGEEQSALLDQVLRGELEPVAVVEWDRRAERFATRLMDAAAFRAAGIAGRLRGRS
jgi:hypothetical protein